MAQRRIYMSQESISHEHVARLSPSTLEQLENFITRPDTRQSDIFIEKYFPLAPPLVLNWIVKHDIFEGVIMHLSLIDTDLYRHITGTDKTIGEARDIFGEYIVHNDTDTYRLDIKPQKSV